MNEDYNKYFTKDYFQKMFGNDPNSKLSFKDVLDKLPEDVGREMVRRGNAIFGPGSGEFACYDCVKKRERKQQ